MSVSTIARQADAVERAAINMEGHIANLRDLVSRRKRPASELEAFEAWAPDLRAAANTMRWLQENEAAIKARVAA